MELNEVFGLFMVSSEYSHIKVEACEIRINGYPIILSREFKEKYAFEEILFVSFEEEFKDIIAKV